MAASVRPEPIAAPTNARSTPAASYNRHLSASESILGDLSGTLDRLTSTMAGQWNLMAQAAPPAMGIGCTGPWLVTLQP
jgi:hypothetical protein